MISLKRSNASSSHTTLFGLDTLRALAILSVFFYHYIGIYQHPQWIEDISHFGWTGVDLFFVLSGFLISSQLFETIAAGKQISFPLFFTKRFFRIIPPYLLVVAIYFLFPFVREREGLAPLWRYLSFTQNLGLDLRFHGTFSHAWSLCIEEQFYLVLPLLLIALVYTRTIRKAWLLLPAFVIMGFVLRYYCWQELNLHYNEDNGFGIQWYKMIYYPTYCRLDGLLIGVGIAALVHFRPLWMQWAFRFHRIWAIAALLVLTSAYFICEDTQSLEASTAGFLMVAVGYGLLLLTAISPGNFLYHFRSSLIAHTARLSYAIYLTHKIIIHLGQDYLGRLGIAKDGTPMFLLCILLSALGAWLLNILVEKPSLRIRNYFLLKMSR